MLRNVVSAAGRATRLAWLVTFTVPMIALALLAFAGPALDRAAATASAPDASDLSSPAVQAIEEWDEEEEEDEAEDGEDEDFGGEDEEEEGEAAGSFPPEECLLRTARSRVLAYPGPDRVKLTVSYTALASASVAVNYRLTGKRGSLELGQKKRRFGRHGVLRLTTHLAEAKMEKVLSARSFTVDFDIAATPNSCQRFYTHRLTIKRSAPNQMVWLQSDSPFGIG